MTTDAQRYKILLLPLLLTTHLSFTIASDAIPTPYVSPRTLIDGRITLYDSNGKPVIHENDESSTCESSSSTTGVKITPVMGCCETSVEGDYQHVEIGAMPQMDTDEAMQALDSAKEAWSGGSGTWPQMSMSDRIQCVEDLLDKLSVVRDEIVNLLMWEIGKNYDDAQAEFDRTVLFVRQLIDALKERDDLHGSWVDVKGTKAFVRRAAIGIIMCLGPFNYPLNETYATLIPALLMGNVVLLKIPTVGGLVHLLTMQAFSEALPPGVINFVSGRGRATMPPLMATGDIDGLAFIGGSNAADDLIKTHPEPHRLKLFLQLEAKNMGIFLPSLFENDNEEKLNSAVKQAVTGAFSYNGQRCTALKIMFVPRKYSDVFAEKFVKAVEDLNVGLPWKKSFENGKYSMITPLPNAKRVSYMKELIEDALEKGAVIINSAGGSLVGGESSTLMVPTILANVNESMRIFDEEQFGPISPIVPYDDIETIRAYAREGKYGQQVAIFTADGGEDASELLDKFSSIFGKININSQCGRSPDTLPFSGRRSSAMGVMSVVDALKEFSVPTVIAYKGHDENGIVKSIEEDSVFMQSVV
eukprot:CAMPEP_0116074754 /NCGR_PEP_ID=MMETSP0322-20121206/16205_1 /TAXON_ID=163516 /ORGANISM="Leptocylindrus danicus var. apora, Strain B651" /LENGTH=585 /DNA_ID=CAMNT_0003564637 /DNA_START=39 /DNA_END=1796 /DNA_ORIENTATION=-